MLKTSGTHEIEISWEPPKGDFTKYILSGENVYYISVFRNSFVKAIRSSDEITLNFLNYSTIDIIITYTIHISFLSKIKIPFEPLDPNGLSVISLKSFVLRHNIELIVSVDPNIVNGNQPKGTQGLPAPPLFGFGVDHGLVIYKYFLLRQNYK